MFCYCSKIIIMMPVITQAFIYFMVSLTDAPKCSHTQLIQRVATQKPAQAADFDAGSLTGGFSSPLSWYLDKCAQNRPYFCIFCVSKQSRNAFIYLALHIWVTSDSWYSQLHRNNHLEINSWLNILKINNVDISLTCTHHQPLLESSWARASCARLQVTLTFEPQTGAHGEEEEVPPHGGHRSVTLLWSQLFVRWPWCRFAPTVSSPSPAWLLRLDLLCPP